MRNVKLNIITLKKQNFKEKDKILTVLSKECGKYDLLAKGAQKPLSKFSGISEPLSYGTIIVSNLKNLGTITNSDIVESFNNIRSNLNLLSHALYLLELTEKCTVETNSEEIFNILLASLYMLESGANPEIVTRFFEHKLIIVLGYKINTEKCMGCGKPLEETLYYNVDFGGFFCEHCNIIMDKSIIYPQALISYINVFDTHSINQIKELTFPENVNNCLSRLYKKHLAYRIDKNINSLEFIIEQKNLEK